MALRKASAYSKKKLRPFTRISKNKSKAYIKTVPHIKLAKFSMGNIKDYEEKKHNYIVKLVSEEHVQVRDNALEAGRMYLSKILEEKIPGQYFCMVKVYPHHMQRENKTAAGAGADRMSTGMTQSFGIVISRAAVVHSGQEIFVVTCANERAARVARDALSRIKAKFPCKSRVVFEKIEQTLPQ